MKEMTLDKFAQDPLGTVEAAQQERILVTRKGQPLAMLVGLQFKDAEDLAYEASTEFWAMIRETRKLPTVRLADVKDELLGLKRKETIPRKPGKKKPKAKSA